MWLLQAAIVLLLVGPSRADDIPLFDAHIHYNHDAWDALSPAEAVERLRAAGVLRALVSSSGDDGTQQLYAEAPGLIIPELRPYRKSGETQTWFRDDSVIEYLEERLQRSRYVAIGEFHVSGADADHPVVRRVVQLAGRHGCFLHAHSDADAIERLFDHDRAARILWAHAGYEPPARVREMLIRYRNLWPELSSREDVAPDDRLADEWRALFLEFPNRFMVGTDTHSPSRWGAIASNARSVRKWLAELPADVAAGIGYRNGEELLTRGFSQAPTHLTSFCPKNDPRTAASPRR